MDEINVTVGLALGALALFLLAVAFARRSRARARAKGLARSQPAVTADTGADESHSSGLSAESQLRLVEQRVDEIEARMEAQAAEGSSEERLQAMASSLLGLIKDKNAQIETALAGLDQMRARLRTLEQVGDLAESRGLFERLETRIDEQKSTQAAQFAAIEERIAAVRQHAEGDGPSQAALVEQFSKLHTQKDAALASVMERFTPLEERLAGLEAARTAQSSAPETLARLEEQIKTLRTAQDAGQSTFAILRSEVAASMGPVTEIADRLSDLHAQKDVMVETLLRRITAVEEDQAAQNPRAALDRLSERLEMVQGRLNILETPGESPFTDVSEQLTRLYAQKDTAVETVLSRLVPLEERLAGVEETLAIRDPRAVLDRFAERLEAAQAAREQAEAVLRERLNLLETPGENPFTDISDQLTRLYAQKDATIETVFARIAPLEARLGAIERGIATLDPQLALNRFAERLEAVQSRVSLLENPGESPFADISDQLTRLYAQKDATVETVFARLAPLEVRLAEIEETIATQNSRDLLDRFTERLEAAQIARAEAEAGLRDRIFALEHPDTNPFADISDQLTRLYAQKDATVETVFARLAPLEVRLAEIEETIATQDPKAALDRFAERLEAAQIARAEAEAGLRDRIFALEHPDTNPFADISDQLTRLYAQKDATVETVFARLAPLEVRLAEIEETIGTQDPKAALDRFAERLEAVQGRVTLLELPEDNPFADISEQLTRLYAQKDATVEMVFARLAPLENRLAQLELGFVERDPQAMLQAFADRLEAAQLARAEAEAGLRDRISLLEAPGPSPFTEISEQLTRLYAQKDATVETVFNRLAPLETRLAELEMGFAERDPAEALDRFAERLRAAQDRISLLEAPGPSPFTEISEQLTRLYAQKDATVETVFNRLAPLEARLAELEMGFAERDPAEALDRFAERLEGVQKRVSTLELPGSSPFLEISEQLSQLYAQKDATTGAVMARLAPMEERLTEMEEALVAQDSRAALDRFAERLEAAQDRISLLEHPGKNPFAEISEQLTRLYAQKDATVEAVFARLAPLEARLGELEQGFYERDPRMLLEAFSERLEAAQAARVEAEAALRDRIAELEHPGTNPFADISDQLTRLYAQKDATVEAVFARLAPLEARLGELETELAAQDPRTALYRFAERLELFQGRLSVLEMSEQNPFSDISDQLMKLFAQKDATVEMVFARLAPLEAKLAELEADFIERDPKAVLDAFAERLEAAQVARLEAEVALRDRIAALETPDRNPLEDISEQLTELYAQKDATIETVTARLAPLEARLNRVEAGVGGALPRIAALEKDDAAAALEDLGRRMEARLVELELQTSESDAEEALAEARAVAAQIAQRAAAEHTELFANRLALLEASLPRLTAAQARMTRVLERQTGRPLMAGREGLEPDSSQAGPGESLRPEPRREEPAAVRVPERAEIEPFPDMPRVVSLHHK